MRTVKDVAMLTGVSVRTLQYYDEIGVLKPAKVTDAGYRLNRLLTLLDKLERGESCMSFKEFDLSEYVEALEEFRDDKTEEVIRHWGSTEAFNSFIERVKNHESDIAQNAVEYYGSVEKYVAAMKDINRDVTSGKVQELIGEMMNLLETDDQPVMDLGEHYWDNMADGYLHNQALIDIMDKKYGAGASRFMGRALWCYLDSHSV